MAVDDEDLAPTLQGAAALVDQWARYGHPATTSFVDFLAINLLGDPGSRILEDPVRALIQALRSDPDPAVTSLFSPLYPDLTDLAILLLLRFIAMPGASDKQPLREAVWALLLERTRSLGMRSGIEVVMLVREN